MSVYRAGIGAGPNAQFWHWAFSGPGPPPPASLEFGHFLDSAAPNSDISGPGGHKFKETGHFSGLDWAFLGLDRALFGLSYPRFLESGHFQYSAAPNSCGLALSGPRGPKGILALSIGHFLGMATPQIPGIWTLFGLGGPKFL